MSRNRNHNRFREGAVFLEALRWDILKALLSDQTLPTENMQKNVFFMTSDGPHGELGPKHQKVYTGSKI